MSRDPLSSDAIEAALADLPGWRFEADALRKTFELADFREAVAFLVRLAFEAEARDHHPEIRNVYRRVELALTTHDAGDRVTPKDLDLAAAIERVAPDAAG
jgi:4a-hydroxytetrahydrobiopterin dehydratase